MYVVHQYIRLYRKQCFILGDDAAEQGHKDLQVFREGVDVTHSSEIHHAIGGLLAVLHRHTTFTKTTERLLLAVLYVSIFTTDFLLLYVRFYLRYQAVQVCRE